MPTNTEHQPPIHSVLVQGEVLSGRALEVYAAKWGLCGICAAHKTHNKVDRLFHKTSYEPITAVNPETGQYTVYKGYCLQPTCYTLVEVQEMLGERSSHSLPSSSPSNKRKSTSRSASSNSTSSSDIIKKKPSKTIGSPSSSSSSISSNSSSSKIGNHRSCSSGLDLYAGAPSESSLLPKSLPSLLLSPQQQKVKDIRQQMHASYSGPDMSSSTRGIPLSSQSPESSEETESIVLDRRRASCSVIMSPGSRGTSLKLMVGPITPSSSSRALSNKNKTPRSTRGVSKPGVPPPPPPYCSLYDKQAAPRCRLKNNEPWASPSALEIKVSPCTPTIPKETKRLMMMKHVSPSSHMASPTGMKLGFDDKGAKNSNNNNNNDGGGGSWDQTVFRPATPDKNLKDASTLTFTPIAAERHRPSHLGDTTSPTSFVAQELEDAFSHSNIPLIVQILQRRRSVLDQETASRALEYLRKSLVSVQRTEKAVIYYYPEMAGIICDILRLQFVVDATAATRTTTTTTKQSSNDDVANQGVLTLMSMAAVSTDYARDIWTSNGTDVILALLAKQTQNQRQSSGAANAVLQERCAAALEVLTGRVIDILPQDLDFAEDEMMMDRLVDVLLTQLKAANDSLSSCPSHSIRALHNLLCCKWPSNLNMWDKMSHSLRDNTELLWKMLESQDIADVVHESILCILGRLNETSEGEQTLSSDRINLIMTFLDKHQPLPLHFATLGFITTTVVPDGNTATIVTRICKTLKLRKTNEPIQIAGTTVIHKLLQQTNHALQPKIVSKIIGSITRTMTSFQTNMSIQQAAIAILASLGNDDEHGRHFVLSQAGVAATVHAFQAIFSCNAPSEAKYAVTSVVARLPQQSLSTTNAEPCLLLVVESAMRDEPEPAVKSHLLRIIRNLLKNMFPIPDNVAMPVPTSNIIDCILDMIDEQHHYSPRDVIQCYVLLATIYSCVPFTPGDQDGSITLVQLGQGPCVRLKTHSTKEFITLWNALAITNIPTACFCALSNYLGPLCALLGSVTDDAALEQALGQRNLRISSDMLRILHGTMLRHKTNVDATLHAMELLRILVMLTRVDVLSEWMAAIVSLIVESMEEWRSSNDKIESIGLNIFARLLQKSRDFALLIGQDCLGIIVRSLESDSEDTVLQSARLLTELLANDASPAGNCYCTTTEACKSIIRCMVKHASSSEVQRQCCIILQRGIGSQPHVYQIANDQGLQAIANALEHHSGLIELVQPACWVLHKMLVDIDKNVLWDRRRLVGAAAISCMQNSVAKDTEATKAIVNVYFHMCSKKDYFKAQLIDSIPLLLQAMRINLEDVVLQTSALTIIKLLCNFGEGRKLVGPYMAVHSVLDALLAHRGSAGLVQEGFVALKMLIWEDGASILMEPLEISETVVCIARIHIGDPIIQKEALALASLDNTILKDVVLAWVIQVMRQHQSNESIQQSACHFLKSHMLHPASWRRMQTQTHLLQERLYNIIEHFWETCGMSAIEISDGLMT